MIFDQNGNAVPGSKPDGWNEKCGEGISATTVVCPSCGAFAALHLDIDGKNKKQRFCPKCHTLLGEW